MRKKLPILIISLCCSGLFLSGQSINHWETVVFNTDNWKYRPGNSEPDPNWRSLSYDDGSWSEGPGGFGFGDNDDNTVILQSPSVCLRRKLNISDTSVIVSAIISLDYDDAFIAYLNDVEIARNGIKGTHPPYNQFGADHEATMYRGGLPESFLVNKKHLKECLLPGENILALEVHNSSASSSDLSSNAWLSLGILDNSHSYFQVPDWFIPIQEFASSNLPVVVIKTSPDETIVNEPKITAEMRIINNGTGLINHVTDSGNIYSGKVGIEIRGRYSASLPQKPYGFETRDDAGSNFNVPILGMPEENDWILTANYNDKAFLRNYLAFELFRKMGHYAPRTVYCEVILNEQYQGIYLLGEKIKQDKNRVDIAKLNRDEISGDNLTGGYIFVNDYFTESDSWLSNYSPLNKPGGDVHFVYYDPEPDELTTQQKAYLKKFVDSFERVLYNPGFKDRTSGYRAYLDVNSFADYFILGELSRNVDAYKKSRFYFKDKDSNGGLIHSGPPWDYDWAWKDITEDCIHFNQTDGSGWAYRVNDCVDWPIPPSWEIRLLQDDEFANKINTRYFKLRKTILGETYLYNVIDSVASLLNEAQERHYRKWPILGINVGTGEYGEQPGTFAGEIEKFKGWIARRLAWLDDNMVGDSVIIDEENPAILRVFPNPAENTLHVESDEIISRIAIFSLTGNQILDKTDCGDYITSVNVAQLKPGLFIVRIFFNSGEIVSQRFVKK
jgi:CotH kinase protein/Secretion system C-terminal sorting domain